MPVAESAVYIGLYRKCDHPSWQAGLRSPPARQTIPEAGFGAHAPDRIEICRDTPGWKAAIRAALDAVRLKLGALSARCLRRRVPETGTDRILMDMAAFRASQGPIFELGASGNDTLQHQASVAMGTVGQHRRGWQRSWVGFGVAHRMRATLTSGQEAAGRSAGGVRPMPAPRRFR